MSDVLPAIVAVVSLICSLTFLALSLRQGRDAENQISELLDTMRRHPAYRNRCPECGAYVFDIEVHPRYCAARDVI